MVKKMQAIGSGFGRFRALVQIVLALAAMAVLLIVSGSPSFEAQNGRPEMDLRNRERLEAAHRIEALYADIPQHGEELGDPRAPVTLHFFADLECPEARNFVLGALPFIVRRWVRRDKLRIVYHAYPAETIWPEIFTDQQKAALGAGEQSRLWQYLDFFYHHQGREFTLYALPPFLAGRAREVRGLDLPRWQASRKTDRFESRLVQDRRLAHAHGIRKTPAFLIGPTGGSAKPLLHFSLLESRAFDEAVERALRT